MSTVSARPASDTDFLRTVLRLDGWGTGIFGVVMLAGAAALSGPLGLPPTWSLPFSVAMIGGGLALLLIAGYPELVPSHANAVIGVNAVSAVALVVLACSGLVDLTGLGVVFLLIGAVWVAVFAGLEVRGVRQAGR
ncbi:hypothetical protein OG874_03260 [Nocardia sp. NBC_00565]|uniref:hypothetical protein n=1 Tax=Nocardia sp. NBC_00565 TaxID=2975993 RepID=UPI002E81F4D0|nr:hypothetical protein [Nocardia sp. NBC_00565]WUC04241.1 hypothetical protein OG874_03260 [Nocardia sp. NBC_00565]